MEKNRKKSNPPTGFRYLDDSRPRSTRPTLFSDILPHILAKYGTGRKLADDRFQNVWQNVLTRLFDSDDIRSQYADRLKLVAFRGKTIRIEVQGSVLFQEISFYKNSILKQFQEELPEQNIRFVKFVKNNS